MLLQQKWHVSARMVGAVQVGGKGVESLMRAALGRLVCSLVRVHQLRKWLVCSCFAGGLRGCLKVRSQRCPLVTLAGGQRWRVIGVWGCDLCLGIRSFAYPHDCTSHGQ